MLKLSSDDILVELGAEELNGSGFELQEPEAQDEKTDAEPEVAE